MRADARFNDRENRGAGSGHGLGAGIQRVMIVTFPINVNWLNEVLASEGATAVGNTPAELDAVIRADVRKWAAIVKEAGIRPE